jgi:glucan phosphoethanolaminetransferase (alkaline phosphatase superfamily)
MKKEITNIDGERLANVIFMWLFIPWIIAVPIIFILFLCGVKIEEVETFSGLLGRIGISFLSLIGAYITVRINVWIYNKIAHRYGGIRYETEDLESDT